MNKQISTKVGVIVIAVFMLIAIGVIFAFGHFFGNKTSKNQLASTQLQNSKPTTEQIYQGAPALNCQKEWREYHQDAFGVSFCYPPEWGSPSTNYLENITRLSTLGEDFEKQAAYYNRVDIKFENNKDVNLRIFNDKSDGKDGLDYDMPYMYYESGMTSNVVNLKKSGNVCDYKVGYDYRYNSEMQPDRLETIYAACSDGIKTNLTKDSEFFDFDNIGMLYSYNLRLLAFKKLANGYFDNLLISEEVDSAIQIFENFSSLEQFFTASKTTRRPDSVTTKSKENLDRERQIFQRFVDSIKVFQPTVPVQPVFKEIPGEDPNITTIRKYYWLIAGGKFDQAYAMYSKKPDDFSKYQEWYKNVLKADPRDFKNKGDNTYEFYVDYQEHNDDPMIYHVTMQVSAGQIKTLASEEITSGIVSSGPYTSFTKNIGDQNYIVLTENGKETVIDQAGNDFEKQGIGAVKIFSDPKFSPSGRYLTYIVGGWEWSGTFIYDVKGKRQVANMDGPEKFGFAAGEKYAYGCMSPGMGGGTGDVYSLPDGRKVFDIFDQKNIDQYGTIDCDYDKDNNRVIFTLKQDLGPDSTEKPLPDKTFKFDFRD